MALPKIIQPTFEVTIPSTKKKLKLRPMLVKEEKILLIAKQSGERADLMHAIKQVVQNCIMSENVNIDKLAIFDVEYLFLKIRAISVSNIAKVSYRDNEDDQIYEFDINLDEIEIKLEEKSPSNVVSINKDISIELAYPSFNFYTNKVLYTAGDDEMFSLLLEDCLVKIHSGDTVIDPKTATADERKEFIDSLPVKAAEEIRTFLANIPALNHEITYKNSKGTERKIVLNSLDDFFTL